MSEEARIAALPLWQDRPVIEPVSAGRTNRNVPPPQSVENTS